MPRRSKKARQAIAQRAGNSSTFSSLQVPVPAHTQDTTQPRSDTQDTDLGSEWDDGDSESDSSDESDEDLDGTGIKAHQALRSLRSNSERRTTLLEKMPAGAGSKLRGVYTGLSRTSKWRRDKKEKEGKDAAKENQKISSFFAVVPKKRARSPSPNPSIESLDDGELGDFIEGLERDLACLSIRDSPERADALDEHSAEQDVIDVDADDGSVSDVDEGQEDDNSRDDDEEEVEDSAVVEAREWLDEEENEESAVDIMKLITQTLKEVKSLRTAHSMKLIMHLTAIAQFIKLRERLRAHPRCHRPALSASEKIARRMGKGPYFARQIRANEKYFLKHHHLPPSKSQQAGGYTLLDNEQVIHGVRRYLASQALGTISPKLLATHLRDVLFPALGFTGQDSEVSERTVINWLRKLGYEYVDAKKGLYHDGHERPDVKKDLAIFLGLLDRYDHLMIKYDGDDMSPIYPTLAPGEQIHMAIDHDECIFHVNETRRKMWILKGQQPLRKKGNGRAIHISDFICELIGRLRLTGSVLAAHEKLPTNSPDRLPTTEARKIIYPGKNHDKWWDVAQLMTQLKDAVRIFKHHFPDYVGIWLFDCSAAHEALAPDGLNVNRMNVNPGGKQIKLRDTTIPRSNPPPLPGEADTRGQTQAMVFPLDHPNPELAGEAKGMKAVLQERVSVWRALCDARGGEKKVVGKCSTCKLSAMKKDALRRIAEAEAAGQDDTITDADMDTVGVVAEESSDDWCCMYRVISLQEDFKTEKPMLQHYLEEQGQVCIFLPKFHCELAAIELLWGYGKYRFRQVSDGKFPSAKELVPKCLDMADTVTIRRFFRKTWRYMDAYRKGLDAHQAAFAVKKYKSHRRVGTQREILDAIKAQEARRRLY